MMHKNLYKTTKDRATAFLKLYMCKLPLKVENARIAALLMLS